MRHHDEDRTRVGLIPFFWCMNERYWQIVHRKEGKRESRTIHRLIKNFTMLIRIYNFFRWLASLSFNSPHSFRSPYMYVCRSEFLSDIRVRKDEIPTRLSLVDQSENLFY